MAKQTFDELVASGKPFNPLSDDQGRAYGEQTAQKLQEAMGRHGWSDPRFLTETQITKLGLKPIAEAQRAMVLHRDSADEEWKKIFVFNGSQIEGLPSLEAMGVDFRKKLGIGLTFDDLVEQGKPFNPLSSPDGQGRAYQSQNLTTLAAAMKEHGWGDPRFVTKGQVELGKWLLKDGAIESLIWHKDKDEWKQVPVFNAGEIEGFPSIEVMRAGAIQALNNARKAGQEIADAEQAKAVREAAVQNFKDNGVVVNPLSGTNGLQYGGKAAEKLLTAMAANGWTDGRFVTPKQAEYAGFALAESAKHTFIDRPTDKGFIKVGLINAAEVVGMPAITEMTVLTPGLRDALVAQQQKLSGQAIEQGAPDVSEITPEPAFSVDMVSQVALAADKVGLRVTLPKIEMMLHTGVAEDGQYVGKVLDVDVDRGLVYQSMGRGKGEVLPMASLDRALTKEDIGKKMDIQVKDGRGTVVEVEQAKSRTAGKGR